MDVIIPSHYRPERLNSTLTSLLLQDVEKCCHLMLVENGLPRVTDDRQITKLLKAFQARGWDVSIHRSDKKGIAAIKQDAMTHARDAIVILIDNDVIFTRADTLSRLAWAIGEYDIGGISPLGYDLDDERPVLNDIYATCTGGCLQT